MSKAAEYFRMLAEIYSDPDRWDSTINPDVIAWCRQAADCMDLIEWAHEVGAKVQPWGSQWRCSIEFAHNDSGHYHGDTLLDSIREAKEAYENEK